MMKMWHIIFCEFRIIQKAFYDNESFSYLVIKIIDVMHLFIDELHFSKKKTLFKCLYLLIKRMLLKDLDYIIFVIFIKKSQNLSK